jgi:predicted CopG family antitoxin
MRTTVIIDDDVYAKVRQMAEESGRTLGQVISQLARKSLLSDLSRHSEAKAEPVAPKSAKAEPLFDTEAPVFRVLIGAAMIPGNRARAA